MKNLTEINKYFDDKLKKEFKSLNFISGRTDEKSDDKIEEGDDKSAENEGIFRLKPEKFEKYFKLYDSWHKKADKSPKIFVFAVYLFIWCFIFVSESLDKTSERYVSWLRSSGSKSRMVIFVLFAATMAYIMIPESRKVDLPVDDDDVGKPMGHAVTADKDYVVVDEEATARNQEEAQNKIPDTYDFADQKKNIESLKNAFKMMREAAKENIKETIKSKELPYPEKFCDIVAEQVVSAGKTNDYKELKSGLQQLFTKKRDDFSTAVGFPVSPQIYRILSENIFPERIPEAIGEISEYFNKSDSKDAYYILGSGISSDYVPDHILVRKAGKPIITKTDNIISSATLKAEILHTKEKLNMSDFTPQGWETVAEIGRWVLKDTIFYNSEITEGYKLEARNGAPKSERKIIRGERIKSSGTAITEEDIKVFRVMKEEAESVSVWELFFKNFFFVGIFIIIAFIAFKRSIGKFRYRNKDLILMSLQMLFIVALFSIMPDIQAFLKSMDYDTKALYFIVPVPFVVAVVRILINTETACFFLFILSAIFLMFFPASFFFPIFYIFGSLLFMFMLTHVEQISQIIKRTFIFSVPLIIIASIVFALDSSLNAGDFNFTILSSFFSALLSGILLVPFITVYEWCLDYATNLKYIGYSTMSNELIKKMSVYANGTYQHSLTVASLVEDAARAMGLNSLACKVMAYFHDIGKLERPEYFTENQRNGINIHSKYSSTMSARIIINHVKYGLELAKRYHLGEEIENAIVEHHGTTLVGYFYRMAKEGNADVSEAEFKYRGSEPRSKETALLMIADSCEAAVRSIQVKTYQSVKDKVHAIIDSKIKENQFIKCNMTTKDFHLIEESLVKTFSGIYHGRVAYPQDKQKPVPEQKTLPFEQKPAPEQEKK